MIVVQYLIDQQGSLICVKINVNELLKQGIDPLHQDLLNQTALFYSSREGKPKLTLFLSKLGCKANQVDKYGQTPLFYAAREGHPEVCKKLVVELGAECDFVDMNGQTPLYYAVKSAKLETVEFLIKEGGANVNHSDNKSETPIMIAKRTGKKPLISLLLQYGAKALEDLKKQGAMNWKQQKKEMKDAQRMVGGVSSQTATVQSITERKQSKRYVLTVLKDGEYQPLSQEDLDKFERMYPDIAKFWLDPQTIDALQFPKFPENAPIYESWDQAAKRLLSNLKKCPNAKYFQEPVDPKKNDVPNYNNIVTEPMDLSTVKQRLNANYYHRMQEFLDDTQLIFENCIKYHGSEEGKQSQILMACKSLREDFKKLYEQLNIEFYLL